MHRVSNEWIRACANNLEDFDNTHGTITGRRSSDIYTIRSWHIVFLHDSSACQWFGNIESHLATAVEFVRPAGDINWVTGKDINYIESCGCYAYYAAEAVLGKRKIT